MKNLVQALLLILFAAFHLQLFAGWEIVYRNESVDGHIDYDVLLIENHTFKYTQNDGGFIFNSKSNVFTWFFNDLNGYWQNNLQTFRSEMFDAMTTVTNDLLKDFPEEERAMYATLFDQMSDVYKAPNQQLIDALTLQIQKTNNVEEIAGFSSEEFTITVNGEIVERMWIAPTLDVKKDLNPVKITEVFSELTIDIDQQYNFVHREEYKKLWDNGFIMKTIDAEGDKLEVIKVEQRSIDPSEFEVPESFARVSAREIITAQMMDGNEDDYDD